MLYIQVRCREGYYKEVKNILVMPRSRNNGFLYEWWHILRRKYPSTTNNSNPDLQPLAKYLFQRVDRHNCVRNEWGVDLLYNRWYVSKCSFDVICRPHHCQCNHYPQGHRTGFRLFG